MIAPFLGLSLQAWGDIALMVGAGAAVLALGAIWVSRSNARRVRVYQYADRFNEPDALRATARYKNYWEKHSFEEFSQLPLAVRLDMNMLPNLVEEVAWLYNRNLLDRNVAAELLGIYVENLWAVSVTQVTERRQMKNVPGMYSEWEEMQRNTPSRQATAFRKAERRRARRKLLHGD